MTILQSTLQQTVIQGNTTRSAKDTGVSVYTESAACYDLIYSAKDYQGKTAYLVEAIDRKWFRL